MSGGPSTSGREAAPTPANLVFILSDEHNRKIAGCYGHRLVQTPNLDALAARGTLFKNAYCNSPICVPSRAALATGRYVHRIAAWDNAAPYRGDIASWHHAARAAGHETVSIGKLHFRSSDDDNGLTEEIAPVHVHGPGDLKGLLRVPGYLSGSVANLARDAGVGRSSYFNYDCEVARFACEWLERRAARPQAQPFALFVSFVLPHFPLIAPEEFYSLYESYSLDELREGLDAPASSHPALASMRETFAHDDHFDDETRAVALRAYFGMVTALDQHVGQVVSAIDALGLTGKTRIIYASDHGDNLGSRGMWEKSLMFEDSVGIPLIGVGAGFPVRTETTPVSLIDIAPTVLDALGIRSPDFLRELDGKSLFEIVEGPDPDRVVFAEYHAEHARSGTFMVRRGRHKLIHYVGFAPQLFDLESDPLELDDVSNRADKSGVLAELETQLHRIVDPQAASERAFADQAELIRAHGGSEAIANTPDLPFTPVPATSKPSSGNATDLP